MSARVNTWVAAVVSCCSCGWREEVTTMVESFSCSSSEVSAAKAILGASVMASANVERFGMGKTFLMCATRTLMDE